MRRVKERSSSTSTSASCWTSSMTRPHTTGVEGERPLASVTASRTIAKAESMVSILNSRIAAIIVSACTATSNAAWRIRAAVMSPIALSCLRTNSRSRAVPFPNENARVVTRVTSTGRQLLSNDSTESPNVDFPIRRLQIKHVQQHAYRSLVSQVIWRAGACLLPLAHRQGRCPSGS
jgi:hypothetical protein